jgi:hypothetical protein
MKILSKTQTEKLLGKRGVVGVGYGKCIRGGIKTDEDCVIIMVERKVPQSSLRRTDVIPRQIGGWKTDVIEVGVLRAPPPLPVWGNAPLEYVERVRPVPGGVSIGHAAITAGTVGCVVYRAGGPVILSNNHVLANSNDASVGDPIVQPGPHDGGKVASDQIGTLLDFIPIKFGGMDMPDCQGTALLNTLARLLRSRLRFQVERQAEENNRMDAALCIPQAVDDVVPEIRDIPRYISTPADPYVGQKVHKTGRTTEHTHDEVQQVQVTVQVQYGAGKLATFEDQILFGPMSAGGDSGSLILDEETNAPVALLFAGSDRVTIGSPIGPVMQALDFQFSPEDT